QVPRDGGFERERIVDDVARIVQFSMFEQEPPTVLPAADSRPGQNSGDVVNDPLALKAAVTRHLVSGTVTRDGESYAEAAVPDPRAASVFLASSSLKEPFADVGLVRRRLLIAGAIALL